MRKAEFYFEINEIVSRVVEAKKQGSFRFYDVLATILNTPTLNIVRCANCKHYQEWGDNHPPTCRMWTDQWDMPTDPNGYCHHGELKDRLPTQEIKDGAFD